jgi:D-alanine-D-alanine ligase
MIGVPYTGASAGQLFICNNKALAKKIFIFHRIKVPRFYAFERGATIKISSKLRLPAIVKPLCEEASRGIAQASIVDKPEALIERVKFIHENMQMDAIVEEYIDGREFYVSILGHKRLKVLPVRELVFSNIPEGEPRIATYKAKWDEEYRKRWGIKSVAAGKLTETLQKNLEDTCKKAYRVLGMDTYMRFDVRVNSDGDVYIIEPNANPCIAKADEVALSAEKAGMSFQELIRVIVQQALQRHKKLTE